MRQQRLGEAVVVVCLGLGTLESRLSARLVQAVAVNVKRRQAQQLLETQPLNWALCVLLSNANTGVS